MEISDTANRILASNSTLLGRPMLIELAGAVDLESTAGLDAQFAAAAYAGARRVTLEMSGLRLIDEAAISSVLRGIETLRAAGTDLEVRYPSPMALQLFEMCSSLQIVGVEFALEPQRFRSDRAATGTRNDPPKERGALDFAFPGRTHAWEQRGGHAVRAPEIDG
jgi:anti-anti-sigma regulatory factor